MKFPARHTFVLTLFALAAFAACVLSEESSPPVTRPAVPEQAASLAPAATPLVGSHPITPAEMQEVRSDLGFAEATGILAEDGESIRIDAGVTSVYEDDPRSVDITFTPRDAAGRPSLRNPELVYQRISGQRPRFYFVTNESGRSSVAGGAPTTQLCAGSWSSWTTTGYYCGYRWLCSKKKWNHDAWYRIEFRSRTCLGGGSQIQTRHVFEHCGC
jgi:hypothetical protein